MIDNLFNFSGVEHVSTVDYPSEVATVIFMGGCPFNCPHCYNIDMTCHYTSIPVVDMEEVIAGNPFCSAVVLSGGEPLMQPIACKDIFIMARKYGKKTAIETSGKYPAALEYLILEGVLDSVFMDIKGDLSPVAYKLATGVEGAESWIYKSLQVLFKRDVPFEIRTTVFPEFPTCLELKNIADTLKHFNITYPDNKMTGWKLQQGCPPKGQEFYPVSMSEIKLLERAFSRNLFKV